MLMETSLRKINCTEKVFESSDYVFSWTHCMDKILIEKRPINVANILSEDRAKFIGIKLGGVYFSIIAQRMQCSSIRLYMHVCYNPL